MRVETIVWTADGSPATGLDYGTRLVEGLRRLGFTVRQMDLTDPADLEVPEAGLHVLTGGSTPVSTTDSWMPMGLQRVQQMIDQAHVGPTRLLGVCLGSQMIAHCLAPGCVGPGAQMRAGLAPMVWRSEAGLAGPTVLPTFHYEQIVAQPLREAGAVIEAWNAQVPVLAYTHGPRIGATQLQPEFSGADLMSLIGTNRALIEQYGQPLEEVWDSIYELWNQWTLERSLRRTVHRLLRL